jgi:hypothetical protein
LRPYNEVLISLHESKLGIRLLQISTAAPLSLSYVFGKMSKPILVETQRCLKYN